MNWFYAFNGQRCGPVSEAEFDQLTRNGTITPQTLVWRDGFPDWQKYETFLSSLDTGENGSRCAECGRVFPKEEMLTYENQQVCAPCKPLFFQRVREGLSTGGAQVWRYRRDVVMGISASLPDRCLKCNVPVSGPKLKRRLQWHHPAVYIALVNLLIYLLLALATRKQAIVHLSLCPRHEQKRRRNIMIGWTSFLAALLAFFGAAGLENGWVAMTGVILLLVSLVFWVLASRVVYARKINKDYIWMGGAGHEFLNTLPEWPGGR